MATEIQPVRLTVPLGVSSVDKMSPSLPARDSECVSAYSACSQKCSPSNMFQTVAYGAYVCCYYAVDLKELE